MAFDIQGARAAGYSDDEIADHLATLKGIDVAAARKSGWDTPSLMAELSAEWAKRSLPAGVTDSGLGGGRGVVNLPADGAVRESVRSQPGSGLAAAQPSGRRGTMRSGAAPYVAPDPIITADPLSNPAPAAMRQPLIEQRGAPVRPEVAEAARAQLAALPREQRIAQGLRTDIPAWMRSTVQAANRDISAADGLNPALGLQAPSLEARTARAMSQGADAPTARAAAVGSALAGRPLNLPGARSLTADEIAVADARKQGEAVAGDNPIRAGLYSAGQGAQQGGAGVAAMVLQAFGDEKGAKEFEQAGKVAKARADGAAELQQMKRRAAELGLVPQGLTDALGADGAAVVGVANSFGQMLPAMAAGAGTLAISKNPAAAVNVASGIMGTQVAGQEYIAGREKGLNPGHAALRAATMGATEILFERFGLTPKIIGAFRTASADVPTAELPQKAAAFLKALSNRGIATMAKEVASENATTVTQYLVDGSPLGLNQPISVGELLEQMRDTTVQTMMLTGMMMAPGAVMNAGQRRDARSDAQPQPPATAPQQVIPPQQVVPPPAGAQPQAAQAVDNIVGTLRQAGALPQDAIPAADLVDGQDFTGLDAAAGTQAATAQTGASLDRLRDSPLSRNPRDEVLPVGDATEIDPIPVGQATEMIPTADATELEAIPTGDATEIAPEVIQADDIMASDGEPFTSRTSAAAKAYSNGGGEVVRIPNHFGDGKPGFVVRPIVEARPTGTRGTDARDIAQRVQPAAAPDMAADTNRGANDGQGQEGRRQEVLTAPAATMPPDQTLQPVQGGANEVAAPTNNDRPMAAGQPVATDKPKKTKVYKNRGVADAARKAAGNTVKVQKVKGGYILRPKTDAEIEAEAKNAKRLTARKTIDVQRDPLLVAIAKNGGLAPTEKADTIGDGNKLTRGGHVFRATGLPIDTMAEYLAEDGYIPPQEMERDGGTTWLRDAIKAEHMGTREHFSQRGEGWLEDRMAEMERQAQMDAEGDPFGPLSELTPEDLESSGYTQASPEVQQATEELLAAAEALGVDREQLIDDAARLTENQDESAYQEAIQRLAREAIEATRGNAQRDEARAEGAGNQDRGQADGGQEQGAGQGLTPDIEAAREGAAYLKDFVYSLDSLGLSTKAQVSLSSPLGKSGRDNLLMSAFGLTREQAHAINNGLDARQPKKLRAVDMQDALQMFPGLRDMVDAARTKYPAADAAPAELLTTQTAEDLRAKAEREQAAAEAERRQRAAKQERLRKEAEDRDARARADQTVDDFQLGQSAEQQMSGMRDMFADAPQIDTTAERVETVPVAAQTEQPAPRSASTDAQAAPEEDWRARAGRQARESFAQEVERSIADSTPIISEGVAPLALRGWRDAVTERINRWGLVESETLPDSGNPVKRFTLVKGETIAHFYFRDQDAADRARALAAATAWAKRDGATAEATAAQPQDQPGTTGVGAEASRPVPASQQEEPATGLPLVTHTTAKGKVLEGYIVGVDKERAFELDKFTFRKDGGYFIRKARADELAPEVFAALPAPADAATATQAAPAAERQQQAAVEQAPEPKRQKTQVMRATAKRLIEAAQEDLSRDRNTNTARRAAMAGSAEADARKREAMGRTMMNLADAIDRGEAPLLEGITTRAQVETLDTLLTAAMYESDRGLSYVEQQRKKGRAPEPRDVANAKLPQPSWNSGGANKESLREAIKGKKGVREVERMLFGPPTAELLAAVKAMGVTQKQIDYAFGWWSQEAIARKQRLARAGINTDEDLRAALSQYIAHRDGPKAEDPIKAAERRLIGQKVGFDFFPTPAAVAQRMVQIADIKAGDRVLEPSAGNGNIADAARAAGAKVDAVEISSQLRDLLEAKGHNLVGSDFMAYEPAEKYDAIVMNPPFSNRLDAEHIRRAFGMLKPGGRLVAIAGEGVFNGSDAKAKAFRDWLDENGAEVEPLPPGTFKDAQLLAQTGANARMIVLSAPAAAPMPQQDERPAKMRTYSWDAVKLADAYTLEQLDALRRQVESEHANPGSPDGGYLENGRPTLYLYDKAGRTKLDKLARAVTFKLQEAKQNGQGVAQEPTPEYSPPYETDLFGNPVPVPPGANRRAARRPAAGAGDVDAASPVQGAAPEAPAGRYASRTALVTTRQQKLGATHIRTIADAANALAYLRTSAVERLDAIVTDEAGKPLAVIGGFKGALSQTSVYPSTLVGEAILTPGARRIWLVHNHPSGKPNLSRADEMLAQTVARTFDGTAIDVGGIVAVAREGWRGGIKRDAFADLQGGDLAPVDGPSVPAQERQIVEDGRLAPGISSPSDAKQTVRRLVEANMGRPTIVLMDSQNQPVAAVPWAAEDAKPLRNNGKLDALFRAVATANAGSAIIGTGGPLTSSAPGMTMDQAKNLAAGLEAVDVRVLDIIDRDGKSAAEQGLPLKASAMFSRATGAGLPLADAQASVAAIREAMPSAPPIDVHATLEDAPAELQGIIRQAGAANDVEGVYWQGRIHVFPQHIASRERLEFVVGHHEVRHHGLAALLGDERVLLMRRLYATNKAVREAADAHLKANPFADRAKAVEEALADMPVERVQSLRGWQRIMAAIRDGLRRFAETIRQKLPGLAAAIEPAEWTDADITALVRRAEDVSRAPAQQSATDMEPAPMFSRRPQRDDVTAEAPATDAIDPTMRRGWIDRIGRVQSAPGQALYNLIGRAASPLLLKTGLKAASPELRRMLRAMRLDVQKAQDVAVAVAREGTKLSDAERAMVSDIVEKEIAAGTIPPEHAVRLAEAMSAAMTRQSGELVSLGMLSDSAAQRWDGKYLPRYYESKLRPKVADAWADALMRITRRASPLKGIRGKHLKGRGLFETIPAGALQDYLDLGWEVRDDGYKPGQSAEVQVWRDFTREEREKMGEIRDAVFRFVMGYMQTQRDIALGRMFQTLALDERHSSRLPRDGWVKVPETVVEGTGVRRYGMLSGRYVPQEVLSHLSQIEETDSAAWQLYRRALGIWKMGKTVLNPVAHANNIISNLTMAHFGGVSYHRADKYVGAIRDIASRGPLFQEARENGLFLSTMSAAEMMNTMPDEMQKLVAKAESSTERGAKLVFDLMTWGLRKPMGKAYEAEDLFFRFLLYREARGGGMEPQDAVDYAQRYIFTYDDLPKGARMIRDFALPFFAYTYKAIPALLHTATVYPHRFIAPAGVLWAANAIGYAIATGDDDDDWWETVQKYINDPEFRKKAQEKEKLEREFLPPWQKGSSALLTPKAIRLGMDELTNLPLFLDASRMIPGGDLFDVSPNAGGLPLPQPLTPSHPLLTVATGMLGNRDLFTGKDLVDKNDDAGEAAAKRSDWLWKQASPAITINNYHWERLMQAAAYANGGQIQWIPDAIGGEATGIGRDGLVVQPKYAVAQTFGIKVRPFDQKRSQDMEAGKKAQLIRGIEAEMRQLERLGKIGALSPQSVFDKKSKLMDKRDKIRAGEPEEATQ